MQKAAQRASKFSAKISPDILAERVARFKAAQVEHARTVAVSLATLESRAKALMSGWDLSPSQVLHYLNYVRELYRILKTNTGWQARLLGYQLKEKWRLRGLDELKLFDLAYNLFHLKLWFHGAVLYLPFEAGRGTLARDYSGYGNDGTIYGAQWVDGKFGKALSFDGVDDYVEVPNVAIPTKAFTYEFWFKPSTSLSAGSGRQDFIYGISYARPHITFDREGDGKIGIYVTIDGTNYNDIKTVTSSWSTDWYHLVFTWDGVDFRVYVNGVLENVVTHAGTHESSRGIYIAAESSFIFHFNGIIDEVRIYNRALSEEEIKRLSYGSGPTW